MSFVGDFIGDVFGGITGAKQQASAAESAAATQAAGAAAGIAEQRRQFDKLVELMSPYVALGAPAAAQLQPYAAAGAPALQQMQAISGALGPEQQRQAIQGIAASPLYQELAQQGESALLQRAAATGGLRGGNIQAALAQFRPKMLSDVISQQYSRLGGLTGLGADTLANLLKTGQASAAGQAAQGMATGTNIANLIGQQSAAMAGGQLAGGGVARQAFGDVLGIASAAAPFLGGFGATIGPGVDWGTISSINRAGGQFL